MILQNKKTTVKEYNYKVNISNLAQACADGNLDVVKHYVFLGTPLNSPYINSPIARAAYRSHFNIVDYLLEQSSIDINSSKCMLCQMVGSENLTVLKYLIKKGISLDTEDAQLAFKNSLHRFGLIEIPRLLLEASNFRLGSLLKFKDLTTLYFVV